MDNIPMTQPAPIPLPPKLAHPKRSFRMQELGLLIVIALLYLTLSIAGQHFSHGRGNTFLNFDMQLNGVATYMSIYAIMAVGMTGVIITGGIDISVGSILGLSALTTATIIQNYAPNSPWYIVLPISFAISLGVGGLCGLLNGIMTVGLRIHPFIITLGTMSIIRCIAIVTTPNATRPDAGKEIPAALTTGFMKFDYGHGLVLTPMLIMLAVFALGVLFLHLMIAGRETYAVGGNVQAARYSGIRVWWVTARVYVIMGLCAGLAGLVQLGRFGSASTKNGEQDELMVIAAAVVGGASLTGGRGTALGAVLGALTIQLIRTAIVIMNWNQGYEKGIVGASIIIAVAIDRLSEHLSRRSGSSHAK